MSAAGPLLRRTVIERNTGMVYINQHDYPHLLYICNTGDPDEEKHYRTTFPMSACSFCSGEVLIRDCDNRDPGFFCFWRK